MALVGLLFAKGYQPISWPLIRGFCIFLLGHYFLHYSIYYTHKRMSLHLDHDIRLAGTYLNPMYRNHLCGLY